MVTRRPETCFQSDVRGVTGSWAIARGAGILER
jgi:hypothetical protein